MNRSDSISALSKALAAAQAEYTATGKEREARIASAKGSFAYRYADLAAVVAASRPALSKNGLAVLQPSRLDGDHIVVTSILSHESGEWISEEMRWPVAATDNRSIGSGITYARRHAYCAITGVAVGDDDDDGEHGRGGDHDTRKPTPKPPTMTAANDGPTEAQARDIKAALADLGITDDRKAYLAGIISDARSVDDYAQILDELRRRLEGRRLANMAKPHAHHADDDPPHGVSR